MKRTISIIVVVLLVISQGHYIGAQSSSKIKGTTRLSFSSPSPDKIEMDYNTASWIDRQLKRDLITDDLVQTIKKINEASKKKIIYVQSSLKTCRDEVQALDSLQTSQKIIIAQQYGQIEILDFKQGFYKSELSKSKWEMRGFVILGLIGLIVF